MLAAYHVLLDDGSKDMSLQIWIDLVGVLRHDVEESEIRLMFMVMDTEQKGSVNLKQVRACERRSDVFVDNSDPESNTITVLDWGC